MTPLAHDHASPILKGGSARDARFIGKRKRHFDRDSRMSLARLAHMEPTAIVVAKSRLRIATRALDELHSCTNYDEFFDQWFVFLTAWKGIYTSLEQGAKTSAQGRQWFGAKKAERKTDHLLQYLFQARNDEEHGLGRSVAHAERVQLYDIPDPGSEKRINVSFSPITGAMQVTREDKGPLSLVQDFGPGPSLQVVTGRGGIQFAPPIDHLGERIDITPLSVAAIGLAYITALVAEAEKVLTP
jgi:hypothetical protein